MTKWWDERNETMVVLLCFPDGVDECVHPNEDGTHTVFLNENLTEDARVRAYIHALDHISREDFYREDDVQVIEYIAHGGVA